MTDRGKCVPLVFDPKDVNSRSMTHQSFAKDADVNTIMKRYAVSGVLVDPMNVDSGRQPRFGDFSDIPDYARLVERVNQAQADFLTLSADVRSFFHNDVQECLDFISNPANVRQAVSMKLLPESMIPVTDAVVPVVGVPQAPAAPAALTGVAPVVNG